MSARNGKILISCFGSNHLMLNCSSLVLYSINSDFEQGLKPLEPSRNGAPGNHGTVMASQFYKRGKKRSLSSTSPLYRSENRDPEDGVTGSIPFLETV